MKLLLDSSMGRLGESLTVSIIVSAVLCLSLSLSLWLRWPMWPIVPSSCFIDFVSPFLFDALVVAFRVSFHLHKIHTDGPPEMATCNRPAEMHQRLFGIELTHRSCGSANRRESRLLLKESVSYTVSCAI